jgi:acetoacetyl-CoA synthetase
LAKSKTSKPAARRAANDPAWTPSPERIEAANATAFMRAVEREWGVVLADFSQLQRWSVAEPEHFWKTLWSFVGVRAATQGDTVIANANQMPGARFFPDARLNFAENLLRRRDETPALIFQGEDQVHRTLTHAQLYADVLAMRERLRQLGVGSGDRVAAYLPNVPEAVVAMLATASLGAIWSSCSPDFGIRGVLDRFGQIEPVVMFFCDGYYYAGSWHDTNDRALQIRSKVASIEHTVRVPYAGRDQARGPAADSLDCIDYFEALDQGRVAVPSSGEPFEPFPFDHPLFILYSSGTTGAPKCIVHGAGGTLLQHLKEHQLHVDIHPGDRLFYFTTCGWMMWNWLVSGLGSEATLVLYDGSPFHPDGNVLFDLAQRERIKVFGTSAKFIDSVAKARLTPIRTHDLGSLETVLSTGSPLVAESYDYVYENIKHDICLASISGGTDIVACFVGGNPIGPVYRGEIQTRCLGVDVAVYDEMGSPVVGSKGELVCRAPIPSMPVGFWNDPGGARYRAAYFERFPGVWCQGDFAEITVHDGIIIYGRSDAVLNPGGVRIGTAEIYRQVEQIDEVLESLVIGQNWKSDVRIVLFVRLREGAVLDADLIDRIRAQIRTHASPRHVPDIVVAVADIPRTRSGKIVELAVRDVVHGRPVANREALANPEALELFASIPELG